MNEEKISVKYYGGIREGDFLPKIDYFSSKLHKPFGKEKIYIVNEFQTICLSQITPEIKTEFINLHGPLIDQSKNKYDNLINIYGCEIDSFLKFPVDEYEFRRFLLQEDNDYIYFWTYHLAGYVEKNSWNANAYLCIEQAKKALFILNDFILSYLAWFSIFHGGFILHGASIIKNGKAYLFFGPPEAGKTTAARLSFSLDLNIISDEYSMVLLNGDEYKVFRPPQRKSLTRLENWQKGYPIGGIYKLVKAKEHKVEKIPKPIMISELLANLLFAHGYNVLGKHAIDNICKMVDKIKYGKLHFKKDYYFWEVIEQDVNFN
jgi:hypothetical protein